MKKLYYLRHNWKGKQGDVVNPILEDKSLISIHFNEEEFKSYDHYSSDSKKDNGFKSAFNNFKELSKHGGIVIFTFNKNPKNCYVGEVPPNTPITFSRRIKGQGFKGFKLLRVVKRKKFSILDYPLLRIFFPPHGTIFELDKNKLPFIQYIYGGKEIPFSYSSLLPKMQEQMCMEWLRSKFSPRKFRLKYLLLGVGRTLEALDIFGRTIKDDELCAQVTFKEKDLKKKREHLNSSSPLNSLRLFFSNSEKEEVKDGIYLLPLSKVWNDFAKDPEGRKMLRRFLGYKE
ncbi:hypothetical protein HYU14_05185 [Candidatus Woesearchaeota archaeon]|nr:hypothetical protein [Candidatus Woesearchaeota archaeon]